MNLKNEKRGLLKRCLVVGVIMGLSLVQTSFSNVMAQNDENSLPLIFKKNMSESRIKSNEEVAIVNCKIIHYALEQFYGVWGYFPSHLEELGEKSPPYIDSKLARATRPEISYQGYFYIYEAVDSGHFLLTAKPKEIGVTGERVFCIDNTGYVRLDNINGPIVAKVDM